MVEYKAKRKYRPLDKGNAKLEKHIFSFSLIPVVTCPAPCKKCYDIKAIRQYRECRIKRRYNTWLAINRLDYLEEQIKDQVKRSKTIKFIRIHVGGEFFSKEYVDMWVRVAAWVRENRPDVAIYTYTKTAYGDTLRSAGINCVASILPCGKVNHDTLENLKAYVAENPEYVICPVTKKNKSVTCGTSCNYCMTRTKVLFVTH